ncbi:unnamed protein product [Cyclocybe aegerita]|uniref:Uncharacterized protein n=1 Tax=Cyclocybe aegerita TaxID=1973307 RepID=A0A8S0VYI9_CYCAE|nr:unnamed protein product [Cyclocybe aegerita]
MNTTTPLPNPFTPMAFLPPGTGISAHRLHVYVWDILIHVRQDFRLVLRSPVRLPAVVYVLSRTLTLTFILCVGIFQTAPHGIPCAIFDKVVEWLFAAAVPTTSLLFLFRVLAIFGWNKFVCVFFSLMWLCVVAGVVAPTQGLTAENIGPTKYCIHAKAETYIGVAGVVPLVNDTLVFLAISWKLMRNAHINSADPRLRGNVSLRAFLRGDYLPAFSRGLLQDEQIYYLTTVTTNLMTGVVFYLTFVPVVYRAMLAVPNAVLMNMMACCVYRWTKSARYKKLENASSTGHPSHDGPIIPLVFASKNGASTMQQPDGIEGKFGVIEIVKTEEQTRGTAFDEERDLKCDASVIV